MVIFRLTLKLLYTAIPFLVYLFFIMPRIKNRPSFEKLENFDYAHRGLHGNGVPENSLLAFKLAVENGYGMELDVRLSKDNKIVVMHDDSVKRMCSLNKKISEMTFDEIRELNLENTGEKIPLFSEVLELVDGKTPIIVEVKETDKRDLLCKTVAEALDSYKGDFCVESFDPKVNRFFKKNRPNFIRGQLMCNRLNKFDSDYFNRFVRTLLLSNILSRPDFIAFDEKSVNNFSVILSRKFFDAKSVVWTVRNEETAKRFKDEGAIIIFENIKM